MKNLEQKKVWCVYGSEEGYIGLDNAPAHIPDERSKGNLGTLRATRSFMKTLWERKGSPYPLPYSIAISLDASECIIVSLINAWLESKQHVIEGASMWVRTLNSPTFLCHRGWDGVSLRILCQGKIPPNAVIPSTRVQLETTGFIPLTLDYIPDQPNWPEFNGRTILDRTPELEQLLTPTPPQYIIM